MEICQELKKLSKIFKKEKCTLYAVGGFVRDNLIGIENKDIDITASMPIDKVEKICKANNFKCVSINKTLGTLLIVINHKKFEYTTFRKESYNKAGEHTPSSVSFVDDINVDAMRRDLTINAIYLDIDKNKFVDPTQKGLLDIRKKIIRTANTPSITLNDDGLRVLRIIRFASILNFKIERQTLKALKFYKGRLSKISKERILNEINQLVVADIKHGIKNKLFLKLLNKLNLCKYIFNQTFDGIRFTKQDMLKFYALNEDSRLITFYLLIVKNHLKNFSSDEQILYAIQTLLGHDGIKEKRDNIILTNKLYKIYQNLMYNNDTINATINYLTLSNTERQIITTLIDKKANMELIDNISLVKARNLPLSIHELDITSEDLLNIGIKNIYISKIISTLYNQVIEMKITNNKEDLLRLAKDINITFTNISKKKK